MINFDILVREHQGHIRAFLTRLTGNRALADDLAQDAFMQAHAQLKNLRSPQAAKAWLFQIAYNIYLAHVRKDARRRNLREAYPSETGSLGEGSFDDMHSAPASPPSGAALDIERAMAVLAPDMRAVILLCFSYGMSHGEAAAALYLPLGTVKSHARRGRVKLRASLKAYQRV